MNLISFDVSVTHPVDQGKPADVNFLELRFWYCFSQHAHGQNIWAKKRCGQPVGGSGSRVTSSGASSGEWPTACGLMQGSILGLGLSCWLPAGQRSLDKPEGCAIINHVEFNKTKGPILHLQWGNPSSVYGDRKLQSIPKERDLGPWLTAVCPRVHQARHRTVLLSAVQPYLGHLWIVLVAAI